MHLKILLSLNVTTKKQKKLMGVQLIRFKLNNYIFFLRIID